MISPSKALTLRDWLEDFKKSSRRASAVEPVALSVVKMAEDADPSIVGRLADVGVAPGEMISYFGRSPLGEPLYISVQGTVLALRFDEAELIEVSEDGTPRSFKGAN